MAEAAALRVGAFKETVTSRVREDRGLVSIVSVMVTLAEICVVSSVATISSYRGKGMCHLDLGAVRCEALAHNSLATTRGLDNWGAWETYSEHGCRKVAESVVGRAALLPSNPS